MPSPWHRPHTQATKAEASEQEGSPSHLCQTAWPLPPCPVCGEAPEPPAPAPALAPAPTPWSLGRGQPAGALQPDPDTPPLTLLQELQTQSHEGRMGVRDPETGKDRKGERERHRSREKGRQGTGAEKARGSGKSPGKGVALKGGLQRKRHRVATPARQMRGQREAGRAKQGAPTQRNEERGGPREQGESDRGQTKGRQGGALKSGSWGALGVPRRDPKGSRRYQRIQGTPKEGKP